MTSDIVHINQIYISELNSGDLKYSTKLKVSTRIKTRDDASGELDQTIMLTAKEVYLLCLSLRYKPTNEISSRDFRLLKQVFKDHILESVRVCIRLQQRTGRKFFTICEGLDKNINSKRILKAMRQSINCNGNLTSDKDENTIIQLQGNKVEGVSNFLKANELCDPSNIIIHGS